MTQALDKMRPRLRPHGGEVESGRASRTAPSGLRLHANGHGCGGTAQTLEAMVEEAVYQAAPDLTSLVIECAAEKQAFVPLEMLRNSRLLPGAGWRRGSCRKGGL